MRLSSSISWLMLVVLTMGMLASLMSIPVWMQNRYLRLMKTQTELQRESRELEARQLRLRMEIGKLSSMGRIVEIAYSLGLKFGDMPVKVMEIPGQHSTEVVP